MKVNAVIAVIAVIAQGGVSGGVTGGLFRGIAFLLNEDTRRLRGRLANQPWSPVMPTILSKPASGHHPSPVPALLLTLACVSSAHAAPLPPFVMASVDIGSQLIGTINHDSGAVALPFVSETNSATGSTPNGSTVSASGNASADEFGNLKVSATAAANRRASHAKRQLFLRFRRPAPQRPAACRHEVAGGLDLRCPGTV